MTVIGTGISWTNSTWNPTTGCTRVSPGCDNCYAEAMFARGMSFKHAFNDVTLHPDRLSHVRKFRPVRVQDGSLEPHKVFVNSMSDLMHDAIPDGFVTQVFDAMENNPATVFQVLTKRPIRARKYLVNRYGNRGLPANIWIGVSVEDNRVAGRLKIMRSLKEQVGTDHTTFFASVEPIIGPLDECDFTGIDWIILGGESGHGARRMERPWLLAGLERAHQAGSAIWLKQHGTIASHPNIDLTPPGPWAARFNWLRTNGFEVLPEEKGGATCDKQIWREMPPAYHAMAAALNRSAALI